MLSNIFIIKLFLRVVNILEEVEDIERDIEQDMADLDDRMSDLDTEFDDDLGRMSYVRQLTAEFLEFLRTLTAELEDQVEIPDSVEMMSKMLGRSERKRYYMSKFRL